MSSKRIDFSKFKSRWLQMRQTTGFKNVLLLIVFTAIAAVFWLIVSLNDNVQDTFAVRIHIYNIPDSVTFINDPPAEIHVNVRDKGTSLLRSSVMRDPELDINFKEFASSGIFRFSGADLYAALRATFGANAQVSAVSIDSLRLEYTTNPGKRVPVVIVANVEGSSGSVIAGRLKATPRDAVVYSNRDILDTLTRVFTRRIVRRGLSEPLTVEIPLQPIPGAKITPAKVKVTIPVEPLVNKKISVPIRVLNVPGDESLLLFPTKADVSLYVPMSAFSDADPEVVVAVDYNDMERSTSGKLPLHILDYPSSCVNVTVARDSVEYSLVK